MKQMLNGGRLVAYRALWHALALPALSLLSPTAAAFGPVPGQGTWETTLQARDFNLDGTVDGYYDTALNITWLRNSNLLAGSSFDLGTSVTDGGTTWEQAQAWAAQLTVAGVTGWRLPKFFDQGTPGCNFSFNNTDCGFNSIPASSELAHMFYVTLANLSQFTTGGVVRTQGTWGLKNTGPFDNLVPTVYSTETVVVDRTTHHWAFWMYTGQQDGFVNVGVSSYRAWAVHDGDVVDGSGVPPAPIQVPTAPSWALGLMLAMVSLGTIRKNWV